MPNTHRSYLRTQRIKKRWGYTCFLWNSLSITELSSLFSYIQSFLIIFQIIVFILNCFYKFLIKLSQIFFTFSVFSYIGWQYFLYIFIIWDPYWILVDLFINSLHNQFSEAYLFFHFRLFVAVFRFPSPGSVQSPSCFFLGRMREERRKFFRDQRDELRAAFGAVRDFPVGSTGSASSEGWGRAGMAT